MAVSPQAVANGFLAIAGSQGASLSPMKIQKLVYFAHGWHLAITGTPLINEHVEAWKYGPVVASLYRDFKAYGDAAITEPATVRDFASGVPRVAAPPEAGFVHDLLLRIWQVYGAKDALELSAITHLDGSPWCLARRSGHGAVIANDSIREYFTAQAAPKRDG